MLAAGVAGPHPRMACLPPLFRATQKEDSERDVRGSHSVRGNYNIQARAAKIERTRSARGGSRTFGDRGKTLRPPEILVRPVSIWSPTPYRSVIKSRSAFLWGPSNAYRRLCSGHRRITCAGKLLSSSSFVAIFIEALRIAPSCPSVT
jgi:hypothetical protein